MIDIITYCDKSQNILKNLYFKPSFDIFLAKYFNHIDLIYENNADPILESGFGGRIFQDIIHQRWKIIIDHITKQPLDNNKLSIFSDIDVLFLDDFYPDILSASKSMPRTHIFFMSEIPTYFRSITDNYEINAGFFVFRHSKQSIDFFKTIYYLMNKLKIKEDQAYIRQQLKSTYNNSISLLDYKIFNTNNYNPEINNQLVLNKKLKVFHATSCFNIYQKLIRLNQIISLANISKKMSSKIYEQNNSSII